MQAEPVADGQQPMTSALQGPQPLPGQAPLPGKQEKPFLKNAGIQTSSTRIETSAERMLRE